MYFKCRRCGKLYERTALLIPNMTVYEYRLGDQKIDLCDDCQMKLEKFMRGKDEK